MTVSSGTTEGAEPAEVCRRLVVQAQAEASGAHVADVRVGARYTAVRLDTGHTGLAMTLTRGPRPACGCREATRHTAVSPNAPGKPIGRPAREVAEFLLSKDWTDRVVGLACINAVLNSRPDTNDSLVSMTSGDVIDSIDMRHGDRVVMIGLFSPLLAPLKRRGAEVTVFEWIESPQEGMLPASAAIKALSSCDVVFLTATSLINHTIEPLLHAAARCREVVVLGASTPLSATPFVGSHVTLLSGVLVVDAAVVPQLVSQGAGRRELEPHLSKRNLRIG